MRQSNSIGKHFYILLALFITCTIIYYFGELVNFFGWEAVRWNIWYTVHDPHRILFLVPILYCSYYYGLRGALISNVIALLIFLPRALFISPYPDPTLRMLAFIISSTILSTFTALMLTHRDKRLKSHDQVRPVTKKHLQTPVILLLIFIFMSAGILVAGHLFYSNYQKYHRAQVEHQLSAIADLKAGELMQWRKERIGDANLLFRNPAFSNLVQSYIEHPENVEASEQLRTWLYHYLQYGQYEKIMLLDVQGAARIVIPDTAEPIPHHIPRDASNALQSGKLTVLDLERDEDTAQPHMVILIPVFEEKDDNVPLGVVALLIDPYRYLYPLISSWPTPSATAETLIVRKDGNDALYLNELRFQKNSELNLRIPLTQKDVPAVRAVLGEEGIVEGRDYRGEMVVADIRYIPDSPWFMVARMDTSEIYSPLTQMLWLVVALVGALLLGAGSGVGLVWRQQSIRAYREMAEIADALRISEERHRLIIDYSLDMIYTLDTDGKFLFVSPASQRIMGYPPSELQGRTFRSFVHPDDVPVVERALKDFIQTGRFTLGLEYRTKHANGDWRWHTTSGNRVLDENGTFLYFVGITHDITERRNIAESLKMLTLRYEAILAAVPDIIVEVDENKVYTWANRSALEFFGKDVVGKEASFFFEGEQDTYNTVQPLFDGEEQVIYVESWQRRKNGEKRLLAWWCRVLKDKDGNVKGALSSARDITDSRQVEKIIQESEALYRTLVETSPDAIGLMDMNGAIIMINKQALDVFGFAPTEDLIGRNIMDLVAPENYNNVLENMEKLQKSKILRNWEITSFKKDGRPFYLELSSSMLLDEEGNPKSVLTVFKDITERKLAEEKLLKSYGSLKKTLDDAINTMVKIVETRDPYTAGHQQNVAALATAIAREMRLPDNRIDQIRTAAVIHDIGKMYIPSDILSKPGRLSDIEYSLIKTHPQYGFDIVKGMDFHRSIAQAILQHHERLDGSGYPAGIKGEDMILEAKILVVADVIEAMAADRPYRPALGVEKALEEISKNRGRLYDPDVVDACLSLFNSGGFKFKTIRL